MSLRKDVCTTLLWIDHSVHLQQGHNRYLLLNFHTPDVRQKQLRGYFVSCKSSIMPSAARGQSAATANLPTFHAMGICGAPFSPRAVQLFTKRLNKYV